MITTNERTPNSDRFSILIHRWHNPNPLISGSHEYLQSLGCHVTIETITAINIIEWSCSHPCLHCYSEWWMVRTDSSDWEGDAVTISMIPTLKWPCGKILMLLHQCMEPVPGSNSWHQTFVSSLGSMGYYTCNPSRLWTIFIEPT